MATAKMFFECILDYHVPLNTQHTSSGRLKGFMSSQHLALSTQSHMFPHGSAQLESQCVTYMWSAGDVWGKDWFQEVVGIPSLCRHPWKKELGPQCVSVWPTILPIYTHMQKDQLQAKFKSYLNIRWKIIRGKAAYNHSALFSDLAPLLEKKCLDATNLLVLHLSHYVSTHKDGEAGDDKASSVFSFLLIYPKTYLWIKSPAGSGQRVI